MTGAGILTDFLMLTDHNSTDTSYRALALKWLDLILKDISNRQVNFQWRFLEVTDSFNTAAGDFDYVLTTILTSPKLAIDTNKIIHVYDKANDRTYKFIPYEKFKRIIADETVSEGDPYIWSIWSEDLLLWPVPDSIATVYIDYIRTIIDAVDTATALVIPDKYKKIIIDGMLYYAFQMDKDLGDPVFQTQIYEAGISRMIKENADMPAEIVQPVSHRSRIDGTDTDLFPIADTNF